MKVISNNIPKIGKELATYGKEDVVSKLGNDVIQKTVIGILKGENIRSLTEALTKRRISLSTASMFLTYVKTLIQEPDFAQKYGEIIYSNITESKLTKAEKSYLNWMAGLTEKQIQNVLRGKDRDELKRYILETDLFIKQLAEITEKQLGKIGGKVFVNEKECYFGWLEFSQLFLSIGSQTLAIRGSEKSTYGKMFEKLVLSLTFSLSPLLYPHLLQF